MRVLHVIPSISPLRGGPSQVVLDIVKALRANNLDIEIATTNDNGDSLLNVPLHRCVEYQQVPVWFFSRFSPTIKAVREYAFSWELMVWLWHNICQYDLLHIHAIFSYASTIAMAIARCKKVPYILIPHGLLSEWSLQQNACKKQIYLRLIEKENLNCSQAIHLTSQLEQQEVALLGLSAPSFVLPLGIFQPSLISNARYLLRQHLNLPTDEPVILFLSRLHPKKGLEYLIPALGKLTHHRFTFVLAGSGSKEYVAEIESLLISTGIRSRTHFAGFVAGETKNLFLQGSDLFALTSHAENFGLSVLEALAVGVPVLLTSGVALASIVQQHQLGYIAELDVLAIASALEHYLSHPQAAKEMGLRAHQMIIEQYTWDRIAARLIEIYRVMLLKLH
ncbi:glycosyltransferase [Cylindrospermum stagnale PCC 7417]|uniref:Glycosyltransferase n=1 Tax=Cylindrospermum stagnale PCC 7417 TaxID=56107 RepID=K9X602_9NOST|nr:glycosyltransferase [Cylindrospermum stagnale]AFZ27938.1 glycosyltransferase [Cylindrospermum stagnale PCC 7417]